MEVGVLKDEIAITGLTEVMLAVTCCPLMKSPR